MISLGLRIRSVSLAKLQCRIQVSIGQTTEHVPGRLEKHGVPFPRRNGPLIQARRRVEPIHLDVESAVILNLAAFVPALCCSIEAEAAKRLVVTRMFRVILEDGRRTGPSNGFEANHAE